jgi:hypothetical protein
VRGTDGGLANQAGEWQVGVAFWDVVRLEMLNSSFCSALFGKVVRYDENALLINAMATDVVFAKCWERKMFKFNDSLSSFEGRFSCFILYTFCLVFLMGLSSPAYTQDCKTRQELFDMSLGELNGIAPCDFVGFMYLYGIGIDSDLYAGPYFDGANEAYVATRLFMRESFAGNIVPASDRTAYLISSISGLRDFDGAGDGDRQVIYDAYIVGAFWELYEGEIKSSLPFLNESFSQKLEATPFATFAELKCFVRFDIVGVEIESVVNSEKYRTCLGAKG